jgi:hypothetical protein
MEHAILIALIKKLTPILEEQDILLNVTIDGDIVTSRDITAAKKINIDFNSNNEMAFDEIM